MDRAAAGALQTQNGERRLARDEGEPSPADGEQGDPPPLLRGDRAGVGDVDRPVGQPPPPRLQPVADGLGRQVAQRLPARDDAGLPEEEELEIAQAVGREGPRVVEKSRRHIDKCHREVRHSGTRRARRSWKVGAIPNFTAAAAPRPRPGLSGPRRPASPWPRRRPSRCGGRPSRPQIACACASAASASASVPASPMDSSRLIAPYATVGPAASRAASSWAAGRHRSSSSDQPGQQTDRSRASSARTGSASISSSMRLGVADQPGQRPRGAGVAGQADVGERHQERGRRPADAEVGEEGERRAGAGRHAAYRGHDRLGQVGQPRGDRVVVLPNGVQRVGAARLQRRHVLAQVLPDAERPSPAPASTTPGRSGRSPATPSVSRSASLSVDVERVHRVRPVQGQGDDGAGRGRRAARRSRV